MSILPSAAKRFALLMAAALLAAACGIKGGGAGDAASPAAEGVSVADIVGGGASPSPGGAAIGPGEVVVVTGTVDRVINEHAFVLAGQTGNATVLVLWDGETADIVNQDATVQVAGIVDTFSSDDLATYEQQFAGGMAASPGASPAPATSGKVFTQELFEPFDQQPFVAAETVELMSVQQD